MARHQSSCKQVCTIQIKMTANTLQIPHMVKAWAAHCWCMWTEGEIFVKYYSKISCCLSVQPVQLLPSRNIWRHISLIWPFPIDTVTPHGLLMLQNCFLDFAVEHWFGCRNTEPGFPGDLGAIEVWLIDMLYVHDVSSLNLHLLCL